ncbi:MAG: cytochrome B5 [Actinobacteria bacterium]|nr:cytochrome B5 [Actinomycetota bacterium]
MTFTLAELGEFDGMDGRPAYVAVDGVVYDITDSALWPEGDHSPCGLDAIAGRDLSEVIGESPHGRDIFAENGIPVVGTLEE